MPPESETVTCRPPVIFRRLVFIAVFLGAGYLFMAWTSLQPPVGPPSAVYSGLVFGAIGLLVLALGIGAAAWEARAVVIADAQGLRWCGLGQWKAAWWDEITDYYDLSPTRRAPQAASFVLSPVGVARFTRRWSNADALRAVIVERARVGETAWGTLGCRAFDPWPRVFGYDTFSNRWVPTLALKLFLAFVAYLLVKPALGLAAFAGLVGWRMALLTAGLYLLLVVPFGLFFLLPLAQYRAVRQRRAQRITADLDGLAFEEGARRVRAAWPDVTGYFVIGWDASQPLYVVQTRQGDFDFLASISQVVLLQAIIQRRAEWADVKEWKPREDPSVLGGEAARWSGGQAGAGARRFHYQTLYNRLMLWGPFVFSLTFLSLAGMAGLGGMPGSDWRVIMAGAAACFAAWAVSWRAYRVCAVLVDDDGLTQITLLDRRTLAWPNVSDYFLWKPWYTEDASTGMVIGRSNRITFRAGIAGREELKAEIRRRASECGGKEWEVRKRPPSPQ